MKINFKQNSSKLEIKLVSAAVLTTLIATSAACTNVNVSGETKVDTTTTQNIITETTTEITETQFTQTPTTETSEVYSFTWNNDRADEFSKYCESRLGWDLTEYVMAFGLTDNLNSILTDFINEKYNTEYKSIPYSKVSYFFPQLYNIGNLGHDRYLEYDVFKKQFLNPKILPKATYSNKLIFSYLAENQIILGTNISDKNMEEIMENMYNSKDELHNLMGGGSYMINYDSSHRYSDKEVVALLMLYNASNTKMCLDATARTLNLADKPEYVKTINEHLKKLYGENAPQIGEVVTKEQYFAMFGEEPLDLSYIPGAIMNDSQLNNAAPMSYYNQNEQYTWSYDPSSYEYNVEESGRSR